LICRKKRNVIDDRQPLAKLSHADRLQGRSGVMAKRTTHRSSTGTKLYAVRDEDGKFKDIQTYKRAHAADLRKKSADEIASDAKKAAPAKKAGAAKKAAAKKPAAKKSAAKKVAAKKSAPAEKEA
jgi:hypothetical protein